VPTYNKLRDKYHPSTDVQYNTILISSATSNLQSGFRSFWKGNELLRIPVLSYRILSVVSHFTRYAMYI